MDRVKIGYRISLEAQTNLKMAAIKANMKIEECLNYILLWGKYPPAEIRRNKKVEKSDC